MRGPSIEFEDVNLSLGSTRILQAVSFAIRSGEIHCIVGANGGGKTCLLYTSPSPRDGLLSRMPSSA